MKRIINYFFQGLLLTVPIVVTLFVIYQAIVWADSLIPFNIPVKIPGLKDDYNIPGMGIVSIFLLVTIIGYFGSRLVASPFFGLIERVFARTPLLKLVYTSVKDLIEAFVGEKKRFNQPVIVTVSREPLSQRIGFITSNDLSQLGLAKEMIAVYFPFSYSFAGELIIVPVSSVQKLHASGTETIKFIISGGVTEL